MAYEKSLDLTKSLSGSSRNTTSVLGSTVDLMEARMVVPGREGREKLNVFYSNMKEKDLNNEHK